MNEGMPDISIIVPVYNVEDYIERCAKSLLEQTLSNLEYIFVNDCSPDKSLEILHQVIALYPQRASQVKVINHATNKKIATVRNTGIMYATGKYIGWVDGDDWIEMNMYEKLHVEAEKYNSDMVWCDYYNSYTNHEIRQSQYSENNKIAFIKSLLAGTVHGSVCFSIVKRDIYIKHDIRFPDGVNVMEDKLVIIKLIYFSEIIKYVPEAYYHYVKDHTNSITAKWEIDPAVEEAAMANLLAIFEFLDHTDERLEFQKHIQYAKLVFKRDLLNSLDINSLKRWKEQFAEANPYILSCPNMTLRQKILGWSISCGWWFVAKSWIQVKKMLIK